MTVLSAGARRVPTLRQEPRLLPGHVSPRRAELSSELALPCIPCGSVVTTMTQGGVGTNDRCECRSQDPSVKSGPAARGFFRVVGFQMQRSQNLAATRISSRPVGWRTWSHGPPPARLHAPLREDSHAWWGPSWPQDPPPSRTSPLSLLNSMHPPSSSLWALVPTVLWFHPVFILPASRV